MKTTPEIQPAFPAVLPNSMRTRFQASSIPSTQGNSSNRAQKPQFTQKGCASMPTFGDTFSLATLSNKAT